MNYYERHIGDYLKDTAHLSLLEHGIYTRLMDVYYTRESAIPADAVARLIGARTKEEKEALDAVLREFFVQEDCGDWVQMRCEREIDRFQDKQRKAKASADARWSAHRSESEGTANASDRGYADDMRTHCEGNAPRARPQSPVTRPNTSEAKLPRGARGSRLPADWQPSEKDLAYASEAGLVNGRVTVEVEKFRDWWAAAPGGKGVKADWPATWRTWVRKAVENGPKGSNDIFAGSV